MASSQDSLKNSPLASTSGGSTNASTATVMGEAKAEQSPSPRPHSQAHQQQYIVLSNAAYPTTSVNAHHLNNLNIPMNTAGAQNVTILSAAPFAHALQQASAPGSRQIQLGPGTSTIYAYPMASSSSFVGHGGGPPMQLVQNPATGVYTLVQPATGVPGSEFIHQHQQSSFQGTAAMEYGHPPPPATVIFQQQPQSSSSSNAAVGSGGGKPQNFECVSGKPLNNEQQPSSASSDIQIIGASSGSHQQPQQMKVMVSVRRPNTRATARRRGQPPTSPNILAPSLNATTTTIPLLPISAPTPTTAMTLAGNKHAQTQQNPHVLVGEQMFAPAAKTRQIAMEKRSTHNQQQLQVPVPVTVITLDHQCQPVTNSGSSMPPSPQKATTSSAAATAGCGGGSLSESQEFKMLGFSINFLDQLGALSGEIQTAVQNLAQTHAGDPGLVGFAESVAGFARLTHSALDELNSHVGNHGSQINGILLRRGGTVQPFCTSIGTNDKMLFDLDRCDHRRTLYDSELQSTVDLIELFEKFFVGKARIQMPELFSTLITEYVLNSIYPVDTEKWTYCVRYSSRNGHRTVPHVLIEELKTQIAKGFGVYGTALGSHINLAIGAAVVNKATRFFNAKRRVSTRASQKSLTSRLGSSIISAVSMSTESGGSKLLDNSNENTFSNISGDDVDQMCDDDHDQQQDVQDHQQQGAAKDDGRPPQALKVAKLAHGAGGIDDEDNNHDDTEELTTNLNSATVSLNSDDLTTTTRTNTNPPTEAEADNDLQQQRRVFDKSESLLSSSSTTSYNIISNNKVNGGGGGGSQQSLFLTAADNDSSAEEGNSRRPSTSL